MDTLQERLLAIYRGEEISQEAQEVVDTFISCFGEEHVEVLRNEEGFPYVQNYSSNSNATDEYILECIYRNYGYRDIVIKFDHETVTNELGLSTDIYDFFVKISIQKDGKFATGPWYKKATFTENQLFSGYIHSHTPHLYHSEDSIQQWGHVCLGSGPINNTIYLLQRECNIDRWVGFIAELRQIVRHESLEGGPYFRLETIKGPSIQIKSCQTLTPSMYKEFIPLMKSYIRAGRLKIGYISNRFCLGVPFVEWLIDFTEYAKAWGKENNEPITLRDTIIQDNKIFDISPSAQRDWNRVARLIGKPVITFRGQTYLLKTVKNTSGEKRKLLNYGVAANLLNATLNILNYWYGREDEITPTPIYF
jgi:hypothetical protein